RTIPSSQLLTCILPLLFLALVGHSAMGQMIRIQFNIPSGTDVGMVPIDPRVINPPRGSNDKSQALPNFKSLGAAGTADADSILRAYTRWVELRARENTELLVQVRYENDSIKFPVFVLNNGTSNYNAAQRAQSPVHFPHFNKAVTMRVMPPKTYHFTAWLGLPLLVKSLLTIEYT
ncbi:MAG: hypothetical protein ACKOQP_03365, partial [Bacteroidota bacterium]